MDKRPPMALVMLSNTTRGMESGSFKKSLANGVDIAFAELRDCEEQQSDAADAAGSLKLRVRAAASAK